MAKKKNGNNSGSFGSSGSDAQQGALVSLLQRLLADMDQGGARSNWVLYPDAEYGGRMHVRDRNDRTPVTSYNQVDGYPGRWPVQGLPTPPRPPGPVGAMNSPYGNMQSWSPGHQQVYTPNWSMPDPRGSSPRNIPRQTGGSGPVVGEHFWFLPASL